HNTMEMRSGIAPHYLIDATIFRAVLLPATMKLLGDWNWYLPRWLEWLPRLEHDESPARAPRAPEPAPAPAASSLVSAPSADGRSAPVIAGAPPDPRGGPEVLRR